MKRFAAILLASGAFGCTGRQTSIQPVTSVQMRADDMHFEATFLVRPCTEDSELVIDETASNVHVAVELTERGGDCDDIGLETEATGVLGQPLGDRKLVLEPDGQRAGSAD